MMHSITKWFVFSVSLVLFACGQEAAIVQNEIETEVAAGSDTETDTGSILDSMVLVPAGSFWMGCNGAVDDECWENESPYHEVTLDGFYIDTYEVKAGEYKACVDAEACTYGGSTSNSHRTYNNGRDNHPINYVNWEEAKTYCAWLGKRLPTEAEWEKAARGIDGSKYPWGNSPSVSCDYVVMNDGGDGCGTNQTMEVSSKPLGVSTYGAHNMIGNVWEWTADRYSETYYSETPTEGWVNPEGAVIGSDCVLRGGSWYYVDSRNLRTSSRDNAAPSSRTYTLGFRCSKSL